MAILVFLRNLEIWNNLNHWSFPGPCTGVQRWPFKVWGLKFHPQNMLMSPDIKHILWRAWQKSLFLSPSPTILQSSSALQTAMFLSPIESQTLVCGSQVRVCSHLHTLVNTFCFVLFQKDAFSDWPGLQLIRRACFEQFQADLYPWFHGSQCREPMN